MRQNGVDVEWRSEANWSTDQLIRLAESVERIMGGAE
jgi:hypothetical protein